MHRIARAVKLLLECLPHAALRRTCFADGVEAGTSTAAGVGTGMGPDCGEAGGAADLDLAGEAADERRDGEDGPAASSSATTAVFFCFFATSRAVLPLLLFSVLSAPASSRQRATANEP